MLRTALFVLVSMSTLAAAQPNAEPTAPAPAPAPAAKMFGVGYKAGNGIGFLGADVLVAPIPHMAIDIQGAFMPVAVEGPNSTTTDSGTIYAIAPALQFSLWDERSTPYISAGMVYAHLALGGATASVLGTFANLGYEWRWQSGLGIQLGGGVGYINHGEASSGTNMLTIGGKVNPNIELGLRYMFF